MQIDNNKALADGLELFKQSKWHRVYNVNLNKANGTEYIM